jgi:hypothetical protein
MSLQKPYMSPDSSRETVPSKVLTNEKSGGLKVIAFDRSPFKGIGQ